MRFYKTIGILGVILFSCINDIEPTIPNEEELITTLSLSFTPENGGDSIHFLFQDLDGDGGNPPFLETAPLRDNTVYNVEISLLNEQFNPPFDIGLEVEEEGDEHQFFYSTTLQGITFQYLDSDANGNPIGLKFKMNSGNISQGELQITLRHEPDKFAPQVAEGNIENAGGETDIQVNFLLDVED